MSASELHRRSVSLDCDTIYFSDVLGEVRGCEDDCGCSFYFEDDGTKVSRPLLLILDVPDITYPRHFGDTEHLLPRRCFDVSRERMKLSTIVVTNGLPRRDEEDTE